MTATAAACSQIDAICSHLMAIPSDPDQDVIALLSENVFDHDHRLLDSATFSDLISDMIKSIFDTVQDRVTYFRTVFEDDYDQSLNLDVILLGLDSDQIFDCIVAVLQHM